MVAVSQMKEADEKLNRSGGDAWRLEKARLQDQLGDKESEISRLKKAEEFYMEEISSNKREVSTRRTEYSSRLVTTRVQYCRDGCRD